MAAVSTLDPLDDLQTRLAQWVIEAHQQLDRLRVDGAAARNAVSLAKNAALQLQRTGLRAVDAARAAEAKTRELSTRLARTTLELNQTRTQRDEARTTGAATLEQRRRADTALASTQRLLGEAAKAATDAERARRDVAAQFAAERRVVADLEARLAELTRAGAELLGQRDDAFARLAERERETAALRAQLADAQKPVKTTDGESVLTADDAALVDELRARLAEAIENGGRCDGAAADLAARLRRAEATVADHAALADQLRARLEAQSTAAWLVPSLTGLLGVLLGRARP